MSRLQNQCLGSRKMDLSSRFSYILSSFRLLDAEVAPEWFWWSSNIFPSYIWFLNLISHNAEKVSLPWASCKMGRQFHGTEKKLYIPLLFAFSCLDLSCGPPQCKGYWLPVPALHPRGKMHPQKQGEMDETYPYEQKYINGSQLG